MTHMRTPSKILADEDFRHQIDPFTLAFRSRDLENGFLHAHAEATRTQAKSAVILALTMYFLFAFLDPSVVGSNFHAAWVIRVVACGVLIGLLFLLSST